ncbi:MAG: Cys-tRNA(Pro) deacylase [Clostridia bacterium]|nr:Cys-tRNA(Pro) deacylase [Clostridia bacterium]
MEKTNAMRILDKNKIAYSVLTYDAKDGVIDGVSVAGKIGQKPEIVYKTLVTQGKSKDYFVFVIPVEKELNLKAAAKAVGEKSVEMIAVKDINKITGYIRGGCSPVGMKKQFQTVIDYSAEGLDCFFVSGGKIGIQLGLSPKLLADLIGASFSEIAVEM